MRRTAASAARAKPDFRIGRAGSGCGLPDRQPSGTKGPAKEEDKINR